jgi:hypothetical protein
LLRVRGENRETTPSHPVALILLQFAGLLVPTSPRMAAASVSEEIGAVLPLLKIFEMCQADGPTLIGRTVLQMVSLVTHSSENPNAEPDWEWRWGQCKVAGHLEP